MSNDSNKEYSVNWKNHMSHVRKAFDHLLNTNELTDVTLYCEGKKIGAHKMLLSACSAYFRDTFKEVPCQHPVIVMYGVEYNVLSDILHFIYRGEVSVDNSKLDTFLKTAQLLQISGLSDDPSERLISENDQTTEVLNSNEREDSYNIQSPIQASSVSDEHKSTTVGTKRLKSNEVVDAPREKVQRSGNDTVFISDVKCEPSELANFEDPLEDPLLQPDQTGETKEYVVAGGIHTEEEFKMEVEETRKTPKFGEKFQYLKKPIPLSTIKTRKFIWSAFKKFCNERQYILNGTLSTEQLSQILADWGFNMKKSNGTDYKEGVVKTIWNTTAKLLQELFYDEYGIKFDPFRDIEFKKARDSRDVKRNQLKFQPEKRKTSSTVFNEAERLRIYSVWDENTPTGLQRKFYHIATFELSWKGREASNCLITYFRKECDECGHFTGRVEYNPSFVIKSGNKFSKSKWLVANRINSDMCPVRLLFKILEKRNTNEKLTTDRLFLAPNPAWFKSAAGVPWYRDFPVGANQISTWVKEAAEKIGIDTKKVKITNISNCPSTSKVNQWLIN